MQTSGQDVVLTGLPRSGTTLVCHLLNKLPDTVALVEPMSGKQLAALKDPQAMTDWIEDFFRQTRRSLGTKGTVITRHVDGEIPDNTISRGGIFGRRSQRTLKGEVAVNKPFSERGMLIIKSPAPFSALLPHLVPEFPTFTLIRNPLAILGSWNSVPLAVRDGHVPGAELLDAELKRDLLALPERIDRQLHLLVWFFGRYQQYVSPDMIIRYEDVVMSCGRALAVITSKAETLNESLESKNQSSAYDRSQMRLLGARLLATDGPYWEFYSRESVRELMGD